MQTTERIRKERNSTNLRVRAEWIAEIKMKADVQGYVNYFEIYKSEYIRRDHEFFDYFIKN